MMDRVTLEVASLSGSEINTHEAQGYCSNKLVYSGCLGKSPEPQTMKNEAHVSHVAMFKVGRKGKKFRALSI